MTIEIAWGIWAFGAVLAMISLVGICLSNDSKPPPMDRVLMWVSIVWLAPVLIRSLVMVIAS